MVLTAKHVWTQTDDEYVEEVFDLLLSNCDILKITKQDMLDQMNFVMYEHAQEFCHSTSLEYEEWFFKNSGEHLKTYIPRGP
jgi:hypothetical protein